MERAVRARKEESSSQGCGRGCTGSGGMLRVSMETGASFWCAGDGRKTNKRTHVCPAGRSRVATSP
jgi:hypothetical protein